MHGFQPEQKKRGEEYHSKLQQQPQQQKKQNHRSNNPGCSSAKSQVPVLHVGAEATGLYGFHMLICPSYADLSGPEKNWETSVVQAFRLFHLSTVSQITLLHFHRQKVQCLLQRSPAQRHACQGVPRRSLPVCRR